MSHHAHASVIAWLLKTKAEEKDTHGISPFLAVFLKLVWNEDVCLRMCVCAQRDRTKCRVFIILPYIFSLWSGWFYVYSISIVRALAVCLRYISHSLHFTVIRDIVETTHRS